MTVTMKKTLFLHHIFAAVIACSGILHALDVVELKGNETFTPHPKAPPYTLSVTGPNNKIKASYFIKLAYLTNSKIVDGELFLENVSIAPFDPRDTWEMGKNSSLNLGGSDAALVWFNITGESVKFDNGVINLLEDQGYTLGGNLSGTARLYLKEKSRLDLNGKTLSCPVYLSREAAIDKGTVSGSLTLENGASFTWSSNNLYITGDITLEDNTQLDLSGKTLEKTVTLNGSTTFGGGTYNGNLEVKDGKTLTLGGNLTGDGNIILGEGASLNVNSKTFTQSVSLNGSATIGGGTYNGTLEVKAGKTLTLSGDLSGDGNIILGEDATLRLNDKTLWKAVSMEGSAWIGGGTYNGTLEVKAGKTLTLSRGLSGTGNITLGEGSTLQLNDWILSKNVVVSGNAFIGINNGTFNGTLEVKDGKTLTLRSSINGTGNITLGNNTTLNLNSRSLTQSGISLTGDSTIGGGKYNGALEVKAGKTLTLCGNLAGAGVVCMNDNTGLDLGGYTLDKDVLLDGTATIRAGSLKSLSTSGYTLDLGGELHVKELNVQASQTINMNGATLEVGTVAMQGLTLTLNGKGELVVGESGIGGAIVKTGEGRLDIHSSAPITGLDVHAGEVIVDGTANAKGSIASLQAEEGATVELVHTNATAANSMGVYKGNLIIGNGSTVTAGCTDGWASESNNTLTVQKGGKLDMGGYRWIITPKNKITLAGGEIAGVGSAGLGALLFNGGANVVAVTEDSTFSGRLRVLGIDSSVEFNVHEGKVLAVTGDLVSSKEQTIEDKTTIFKTGAGTMVMSGSNAVPNGTIIVQAGTLKVTGDANPLGSETVNVTGGATLELGGTQAPTGSVTLAGGSIKLTDGLKDFALKVTGEGNRLEGNLSNAFTGSLTLEEGSHMTSHSAMASWDGPKSLVMKDGSRLEMAVGYDEEKQAWKDNWINDISAIKVEGVATIKDAFIRIKPGTEYTLGNGVENLVGEGITSIALDNSIFNLDSKTTNLNIKVWSAQKLYNLIKDGTINTHVEIESTGKLTLENVAFGSNAAFTMGNATELDLGGAEARLAGFTFTGAAATVDNGTLFVGNGDAATLNPVLSGTYKLELRGGALNLGNNAITKEISVTGNATIANGSIAGGVTVAENMSAHFSGETRITGAGAVTVDGDTTTVKALDPATTGLLKELTVSKGLIAGTDRQSSLADGLDINRMGYNLTLENLVLTANNKISVGDGHTITLNQVTIDLSKAEYQLVDSDYYFQLQDLINCTLEMDDVVFDASGLELPTGFDPAVNGIGMDFGPDVTIDPQTARNLTLLMGGDWSQTMNLVDGKPVFTALVPTPEPTTGTLSLLGLAALAARRRRK